jgi:tRNA(fMet)-specific endonuclease VapC
MIATTALAHHMTLVTHNVSEFKRIDGLGIEDWQQP